MAIKNKYPLVINYDANDNVSGLAEVQFKTSDLSDIGDNPPSLNQVLAWTSDGKYQPQTITGGGVGGVTSVNQDTGPDVNLYLSSLSGVDTSDLQEDHNIVYDGTNWISQYPQNQYIIGTNPNAGNLVKGDIVYISDATNGGDPELSLALANSSATMPSIGIVRENITTNNSGPVVTFGTALDLTFDVAPSAGDVGRTVYVSPLNAGRATLTKPSGATHLIQNVGVLVDDTPIKVKVTGVGRANDIPVNVDVVGSSTIGTNEFTQTSAKLANVDANHILISTAASATSSVASATLFSNYHTRTEASNAFIEDPATKVTGDSLVYSQDGAWVASAVGGGTEAGSTASPEVIFKGVGYPVASGNSTSYTNFVSSVISSSVLSSDEDIEIDVRGRILGAGTNISWKFSLNGTSYLETGTGQSSNDTRYHMRIYISKLETNRQMIVSEYIQLAGNAQTQGVGRWESIDREGGLHNEATETESNDLTVELDWRNNATNTAQIGTVDSYVIKRIPIPAN